MTNGPENNSVSGMKNVLLFIGRSEILQTIITLDYLDGYFLRIQQSIFKNLFVLFHRLE